MKQVIYRKKESLKNRHRGISIDEFNEDQESRVHIKKSFIYKLERVDKVKKATEKPHIYIIKKYDSKMRVEHFSFRVKGHFYMTRDRHFLKVNFCHILKIDISWKNKVFSPKKSGTLT